MCGVDLEIRPLEPDDVEGLVALALRAWKPVHASMAAVLGERINRLVYPDWTVSQAADVRAACADPHVEVSVATSEAGLLLGFVTIVIDTATASGVIDMIAVDPVAHRQGIGRALTEHALARLREAGCTYAHVATGGDPGHAPARALYDAAGFTALPLVHYYREL